MLLAINIRNSFLELGIFEQEKLVHTCRVSAKRSRTADQYAILLKDVFLLEGYSLDKNTQTVLASVVPELQPVLCRAVYLLTGCEPLVIDAAARQKFGVSQADMAPDTVCAALYAAENYPLPAVLVDNGTAIRLVGLDKSGTIAGCAICPGIELSLKALTSSTSQLPAIAFRSAQRVLGQTTEEALNAGLIMGAASMIDGMIERFDRELGGGAYVVLTGRHTEVLAPLCSHKMTVNNALTLKGLRLAYCRLGGHIK